MAQVLELQFETTEGKTSTISIDAPRQDVTAEEIQQAMETIITANVFEVQAGAFVGMKGARIVDRQVSPFELDIV
ncbi:DUF2922 domain-containing protein [Lysinibacillus sp. NPDC096418]|uniref:DUF2922 domain-containing protein n=1 Tax=Lysinibacillus sp. NPDC096418 TaxID=3364138 RepID=UPI0037F95ED7